MKQTSKFMSFVQNLYCRIQDDEVPAMGAQLTYYLILSFFPFLIFLISLINFTPLTSGEIINGIMRVLPTTSFTTITDVLAQIQQAKSPTLLSIGGIAAIWSASKGVDAIVKGLNKAYDEEETRPFWKVKGLSVLFTIVLGLVILSSFVLLIFGKIIGEQIFKFIHLPGFFTILWAIAQIVIPLAIMAAVFTGLYAIGPNRHLKIKEVLPGALFTTIGWVATSLLFSFYVNNFGNYTKTYGSLGGVIVLLTWMYLSSTVIIMGGEINATLAFDREGKTKAACKKFSLPLSKLWNRNKKQPLPETIKPLYARDDRELAAAKQER
jgi:membrane protein